MGRVSNGAKNHVIGSINSYAQKHLGSNLAFSAVFGSYAYNDLSKNDIDMIFVTRDCISQEEKTRMEREYFALHERYDLNPDHSYPGEYVSLDNLKKAEMGWGFLYEDKSVKIPLITCGSDWNDFNDYRHHLTAVGGPTIFLDGSMREFQCHKTKCLKTLMGVLLLSRKRGSSSLEEFTSGIVGIGKDFLGFVDTPAVRNYLSANLNGLLHQLVLSGEVIHEAGTFSFRDDFLRELEQSIKEYNEK